MTEMADWFEEHYQRTKNQRLNQMQANNQVIIEVVRRAVRLAQLSIPGIENDASPHMVMICGEWYFSFRPHPPYDPSPEDNEPPPPICEVGASMKVLRTEWLRIRRGTAMDLMDSRLVLALSTFSFFGVCSVLGDEQALRDEVLPALRRELVLDDLGGV